MPSYSENMYVYTGLLALAGIGFSLWQFNVMRPVLCFLQEIDGKALMLLRSDMIMKYMGLKLGPALKLCHHIERLKQGKL